MTTETTLCLAHGPNDKPNGCAKADQCERHVALRAKQFPEYDTMVGCLCVKKGHLLFVPTSQPVAA